MSGVKKITVEFAPGTNIAFAFNWATSASRAFGIPVHFEFNGMIQGVEPTSNPAHCVEHWMLADKARQEIAKAEAEAKARPVFRFEPIPTGQISTANRSKP